MSGHRTASLTLLVLLSGACGDDDATTPLADAAMPTNTIPADVEGVLRLRCQPCHSDPVMRFAPMPIVTWEQVHAPTPTDPDRAVLELIAVRVASDSFPMPPKESPELAAITAQERQLLLDWAAMGAPSGQ